MYRLEYTINEKEEDGATRKESIVVDKSFVTLAAADSADIQLSTGTMGKYTIEQAKNGQVTLRETEDTGLLHVNDQPVHASELRDGDIVTVGDTEFRYFYIEPPVAITSRKSSLMQLFSTISVGCLLFAQVLFLAWVLVFWRIGQDPLIAAEKENPTIDIAQATPAPTPEAIPELRPGPVRAPEPPLSHPTPPPKPTPSVKPKPEQTPPPAAPTVHPNSKPAPAPAPALAPAPAPAPAPKELAPRKPKPEETNNPEIAKPPRADTPTPAPAPSIATPELRPVPTPKPEPKVFPNLPDIATEIEKPTAPPIDTPESMLLRSAHDQTIKGNLIRADDYYKLLQNSNPSYLPVYSDRARLFEKRGMLKEAIDQWSQLKTKSGQGSRWSTLAGKERTRLQQRLRALEASYSIQSDSINTPVAVKPPAPATPIASITDGTRKTPTKPQKYVEILSAEAPQMGSGDNYAYMRILNIELAALAAIKKDLGGKDVKVRIQFYDQDRITRRIYPSEVYVPRTEFVLSGTLPPGEPFSVTCPYTVPIDFREKQAAKSKRNLVYYGFTVELFYVNHLQDYTAKPLSLASRIKR